MEFYLVQNRKENRHHDHIPFNLKGNRNTVFSVWDEMPASLMKRWRNMIGVKFSNEIDSLKLVIGILPNCRLSWAILVRITRYILIKISLEMCRFTRMCRWLVWTEWFAVQNLVECGCVFQRFLYNDQVYNVHTAKSYYIKPKSDCIYHFPIDLKHKETRPFAVPNQSENGKYNLISVWFNQISLCAAIELYWLLSHACFTDKNSAT